MAIDINGDGLIQLGGTSTTQGRVRLNEDTDNGTNYVELTSAASITSNRTVTFPDADINFATGLSATLGGTGLTSAGTNGNVLTSNGTAWVSQAAAAGGGDYIMQVYASPATWTKPAGLKAVKVTVVGGGGGGGPAGSPSSARGGAGGGGGGGAAIKYLDEPAVPGPVSVTVGAGGAAGSAGGTSSFGAFASATGGSGAPNSSQSDGYSTGAAGGSGSSGNVNVNGGAGVFGISADALTTFVSGSGGSSILGGGAVGIVGSFPTSTSNNAGTYGGGGSGAARNVNPNGVTAGGTGGAGIVIVEEFY